MEIEDKVENHSCIYHQLRDETFSSNKVLDELAQETAIIPNKPNNSGPLTPQPFQALLLHMTTGTEHLVPALLANDIKYNLKEPQLCTHVDERISRSTGNVQENTIGSCYLSCRPNHGHECLWIFGVKL